MHTPVFNAADKVDPVIVETWISGWTLARETSSPVKEEDCFRVDVGWPDQKTRYVFPFFGDRFKQLAETVTEPFNFLKVCEEAETVRNYLPSRWSIDRPRFMMICDEPMSIKNHVLSEGYTIEVVPDVAVVKIRTTNGEEAASGYVVFVNEYAVYDRIITQPLHRRKGLATIVMKTLEEIAASKQVTKSILVATEEGKALYHSLGWKLYAPYTTAFIPGP